MCLDMINHTPRTDDTIVAILIDGAEYQVVKKLFHPPHCEAVLPGVGT